MICLKCGKHISKVKGTYFRTVKGFYHNHCPEVSQRQERFAVIEHRDAGSVQHRS